MMRCQMLLAIACLVLGSGMVPAQESATPPPPSGPPVPYLPSPEGVPPSATPPSTPCPPTPSPVMPGPPTAVVDDWAFNPSSWVGIDALLWWTKNQPLSVPVVTTGPAAQGANAGNLGVPGTTSLVRPLDHDVAGGVRLFLGGWFDCDHTIGVDGSLFFLGQQEACFSVADRSGIGSLVLNEPVVGIPYSTQVSAPGLATGSVDVSATSRLGGADVNLLYNLVRNSAWTVNLVGGYRYLDLKEKLIITGDSSVFNTVTYFDSAGNVLVSAPPGSSILTIDQFEAHNQFSGGQIGVSFQYLRERWSVGGSAKLAIGATHQAVTVDGSTIVFPVNGDAVPLLGGNYATVQIGGYSKNRFAVAPEAQLNVGYQISPYLRALVGYDFLFLSSVARPGNQIDNNYDGVNRPTVFLASSTYWAQGLTMGLQLSY